jgi:uncharacterized protein (DUF58 family)
MNWERSAVVSYLRFLWQFRFTSGGKWIMAGLLLSGLLGSASVQTPIYQIFCMLLAFFCVDRVAGFLLRPRLLVRGTFPDKTTAGQAVTGHYTVQNQGRLPAYDLGLHFFRLPASIQVVHPEMTLGHLSSGQAVSATVTLQPHRRGLFTLPRPRAYSTFPFHLSRDGRSRADESTLLVLPHFHPIVGLDVPIGSRYQPGGIALTSNIGESPEYIGNREYVPGDSARHIDYRSWARLAQPVVREYQEEYYCRVALVLDTFVPPGRRPGRDGFPDLEAAISLSASIADALSRGEYLIDLFAAGPELYVFRAGRHTAHFENILEIVACVDACRSNPFQTVAPALADELTNISTVVGVLLDWDASRRQLVRTAVEMGCSVKILIVRDGPTSEPIDFDEGSVIQLSVAQVNEGGLEVL